MHRKGGVRRRLWVGGSAILALGEKLRQEFELARYKFSPRSNPGLSVTRVIVVRTASLLNYLFYLFRGIGGGLNSLSVLKAMRNSRGEKLALVLANGRSLNSLNPEVVEEMQECGHLDVFAINGFFLSELGSVLKPDFYVLSDPLGKKDIPAIMEKYPGVSLMVPRDWKFDRETTSSFANGLVYFEDQPLQISCLGISPIHPRVFSSLTALKAMSIAAFLGYSRIGVIGLDADLHLSMEVTQNNRIIQRPRHHNGSAAYPESGQYQTPLLDETGRRVGQFSGSSDYFYAQAMQHYYLETKFSRSGKFVNLSDSSHVTAFPREALESFLRGIVSRD